MRDYITPDDICNQMSMMRTTFKGVIIMVEGNTNVRFFGKFIDRSTAKVFSAYSKSNVKDVVRCMTQQRNDDKVIGITDADLDRLENIRPKHNIFLTDCRDMEMMLLKSQALDNVLDEYGDPDKIQRYNESSGSIRDNLVSCSRYLGLLMLVSKRNGYNLNFSELDFDLFISRKDMSMDIDAMIDAVMKNTLRPRVSKKVLKQKLDECLAVDYDPWDVARGHDSVSILTAGLKNIFGSYTARSANSDMIGGALRIGYSMYEFSLTRLFSDISAWAETVDGKVWKVTPR